MAKTSKLCSGVFSKAYQRFSQRGYMHRALWLALQLTVFAAWQLSGADLTWQRTSLDQFGADIAVAVHPDGSFLAADGFDIKRSVNFGTNWSTASGFATFAGGSFAIDPSDPSILYAGRSHGLLKSASGGASCFELADLHAGGSANAIVVAPSEPWTVFAGVGDGWGVYKSLNRGGTWTHVLESRDVTALAVHPSDPLVVLAGTIGYYSTPGGVLQSQDGGTNWTQYLSGMDVTAIAFDTSNPPIAYAGTSTDGIFRSADGGQTWDALAGSANLGPVTALVVHPAIPQQVFVAISAAGIYASVDGGISWKPQNVGLSDLNVKALAIRPNFPFTLLAGTVGGQGFLTNPDLSPAPPEVQVPQIVTQPQDQTVVSGQSATLNVEVTGSEPLNYQWYGGQSGDTGQPITGATQASYNTSALTETTSFWVRVSNAAGSVDSKTVTVTVTIAEVTSWQAVSVPGLAAGTDFHRVWTPGPGEVYVWAYSGPAASVTSTLYRLHQEQWQPVLEVSGEYPASVFGTGANEVFAATQNQLWRSTDKGDNWTLQSVPGSDQFRKITGTPDNVQVSRTDGGIARFDGSQWQLIYHGPDNLAIITVLGPAEGYYLSCWGWGTWNGSQWQYHSQGFDFCDIYDTWAIRDAQGLHWWAVGNNNFSNGIRVWCWDEASGTFGSKRGYCFNDGSGYNVGSADGIWGSSANDVYVFGGLASTSGGTRSGRLYHFDGSAWTRLSEPDLYPTGVWGTASDDVWIAGNEGKLFHLTTQAPHTEPDTITRRSGRPVKVPASQFLANDTDPDGDPLNVVSVSANTTQGGTVSLTDGWVLYTPPTGPDASDTFTYTVADPLGLQAVGQVTVTVQAGEDNPSANMLPPVVRSDDTILIRFAGIPGRAYRVQVATQLGPLNWQTIATATIGDDGFGEYHDTTPLSGARFYRTVTP